MLGFYVKNAYLNIISNKIFQGTALFGDRWTYNASKVEVLELPLHLRWLG